MVLDIDELLIAVFLTLSIVLIVAWYVAILKWRKHYISKVIPCYKIKSKRKLVSPHKLKDFKYPEISSINVISSQSSHTGHPSQQQQQQKQSAGKNYHDNAQFVEDDSFNRTTQQYEQIQPKYTYKIDSNNNMIIDSPRTAAATGKSVAEIDSGGKDLVAAIQENLQPAKNEGVINQMRYASSIRQESYKRYNDEIVHQVDASGNEVIRF